MIRRWLARWRAERQYRKMVAEARNDWRVVHQRHWKCIDTSYGERIFAGTAILVAEQNALGERRSHFLQNPWPERSHECQQEIDLWVAAAEPRCLPRPELETIR